MGKKLKVNCLTTEIFEEYIIFKGRLWIHGFDIRRHFFPIEGVFFYPAKPFGFCRIKIDVFPKQIQVSQFLGSKSQKNIFFKWGFIKSEAWNGIENNCVQCTTSG